MRIAVNCVQTLIKIQDMADITNRSPNGESYAAHHSLEKTQREHGSSGKMKLGRLLANTEIYPCVKRACVKIDAVHKSRIGPMQIRGQGQKKHMASYYEETEEGEVELTYGRIERMIDDAAENSRNGTKAKFKDRKS